VAGSNTDSIPQVSKLLLVAAVVALVFAAGGVVFKILPTREATIQSIAQLELYRYTLTQSVSPARVEHQIIDILIKRLAALRDQNKARARWLNISAKALGLAVLLAAVSAAASFLA
jgi:hypothetical protein